MEINKKFYESRLKVIQGYIEHFDTKKDGCECAICMAQEQNTYLDGLIQAEAILTSFK